VARIGEAVSEYRTLGEGGGEPLGKPPLGSPGRRWKGIIQMNLRKMG
jgi:hypothetical protein